MKYFTLLRRASIILLSLSAGFLIIVTFFNLSVFDEELRPEIGSLLQDQQSQEILLPRRLTQRVKSVASPAVEPLSALWCGSSSDLYGLDATLMTAAAALVVINPERTLERAIVEVTELWEHRNKSRLS